MYILSGWCSEFVDPGFEFEFKTLAEAKAMAIKILEKKGQTTLRIYKASKICEGRRGNSDKSYIFETRD